MRNRRLTWAIVVLGLSMFAGSWCRSRDEAGANTVDRDVSMLELERVFKMFERTWAPDARDRVVADLRPRRAVLQGPLQRVLRQPTHPRFPVAATLAAAWELRDLREALVAAVRDGPASSVGPALIAADQLAPWAQNELAALLQDGARAQQIAVLSLCEGRADSPVRVIEDLLFAADVAVARSALAALPPELSEIALGRCITLCDTDGPLSGAALDAVGSRRLPRDVGERVINWAFAWTPSVQLAVLTAAARGGVGDERMLWGLARSGDDGVRTKALELLDARGCADTDNIRGLMTGLSEEATYWAARCLLRGNDRHGLNLLLDLAEPVDGSATWANLAARILLAEMSSIPAANGPDAWRRWAGMLSPAAVLQVPPAAR